MKAEAAKEMGGLETAVAERAAVAMAVGRAEVGGDWVAVKRLAGG